MSANWAGWLALGACVATVGCSSISGKSNREPPLPPGVDPSNLFNTAPAAPVQLVDATPYYRKDDVAGSDPTRPAVSSAGASRAAQERAGERIPPTESDVIGFRVREQDRQTLARARERQEFQKEKLAAAQKEFNVRRQAVLQNEELWKELNRPNRAVSPDGLDFQEELRRLERLQSLDLERFPQFPPEPTPLPEVDPDAVKPGEKYDILILAGGGSRSLFLYGVVCGWADCGTLPDFAVVTGVSGGAFAATLAFAGTEYLADLRRIFLALDQKKLLLPGDAWHRKRFPHPLGAGTASIADTSNIRRLLKQVTGRPDFFVRIAAEHARGRRLYVGTTNLHTQRFVTWDMGAIAAEGTAASRELFEDILMASAAVPPLMEPSRIRVTIDGKAYEELHVDGGTARNLFFYPPADWPGKEEDEKTGYRLLAGARVHVVLGGKVYETPETTDGRVVAVGMRSVGSLQASLQRAELARIHAYCQVNRMTMRLAAIPPEYDPLPAPNVFDPVQSDKLFREGYTRAQDGTAFGPTPERAVSEDRARRGTALSSQGTSEIGNVGPVRLPPVGQQRVRGR